MDIFTALIYGVIQGVSEFLPVSSSGHLALLPYMMAIQDPGVVFDLGMHLGTALAVVIYFRAEVSRLLSRLPDALAHRDSQHPDTIYLQNLLLATAASVSLILVLRPLSHAARDPWFIAFNQAFFGILLLAAEYIQRRGVCRQAPNDHFAVRRQTKHALLVGLAQALAIFPGVSRSGITLTAAFMVGISRREAGAFSFLLSLPIIIGGALIELPHLLNRQTPVHFDPRSMLVGIISSFVVGYATIHYFMKLIARINLGWFTLYRLMLALWLAAMLKA